MPDVDLSRKARRTPVIDNVIFFIFAYFFVFLSLDQGANRKYLYACCFNVKYCHYKQMSTKSNLTEQSTYPSTL